jgi:hypothetical protein
MQQKLGELAMAATGKTKTRSKITAKPKLINHRFFIPHLTGKLTIE